MQGCTRFAAPAQVSNWHLADMPAALIDVRYRGENGHTASTREPTLLTRKRHVGLAIFAAQINGRTIPKVVNSRCN